MNCVIILTFSLIVSCNAKIKINIKVASNIDDANLTFSGVDNKLIDETEITLFNFTKENLNRGMRVELGKVPNDIFWQDPTPYDNLFEFFEWPPVVRSVRVTNAKVIEIVNENVVASVRDHTNNTTRPINAKINAFELMENTIMTTWGKGGVLKDEIYFDVNLNIDKINHQYSDKWRNNSFFSVSLPFGITKGFKTVIIRPRQTVTSKISAKKTIFLAQIEYLSKLNGNLIADYDELYGKYHFYSPTVNNIMKAAKMNNEIRNIQWIEIRCYTDPKFEVYDSASGRAVPILEHKQFHLKKKVKDSKIGASHPQIANNFVK